jgi:hypothetical protein
VVGSKGMFAAPTVPQKASKFSQCVIRVVLASLDRVNESVDFLPFLFLVDIERKRGKVGSIGL